MSELLEDVNRPSWWFSVVLAGLFVNLLAAYLKPYSDRLLGSVSDRWRRQLAAEEAAREKQVARWRDRPDAAVVLRLEKLEHVNEQRVLLLWSLVCIFFASRVAALGATAFSNVLWWGVTATMVASLWRDSKAAEVQRVLDRVEGIQQGLRRPPPAA